MDARHREEHRITLRAQARQAAYALGYVEVRCDECGATEATGLSTAVRPPCRRCDELGILWVPTDIVQPRWHECLSATEVLATLTLRLSAVEPEVSPG